MIEDRRGVRLSGAPGGFRYGPDAIPLMVACFEDKDENVKAERRVVLQSVQSI